MREPSFEAYERALVDLLEIPGRLAEELERAASDFGEEQVRVEAQHAAEQSRLERLERRLVDRYAEATTRAHGAGVVLPTPSRARDEPAVDLTVAVARQQAALASLDRAIERAGAAGAASDADDAALALQRRRDRLASPPALEHLQSSKAEGDAARRRRVTVALAAGVLLLLALSLFFILQ